MTKTHGEIRHVTPDIGDPYWEVEASPYVAMRVKRIFPRVQQRRTGALAITDTLEVARDLEWLLHRFPLTLVDEASERLPARADAHREREVTVEAILAGRQGLIPGVLEPAREPREYQRIAADLALATEGLLLADDLGLGKSFSGLLTLCHPDALPALIVCQTHLPAQWVREIDASFPLLRVHIAKGTTPYPIDADVIVMSYSKISGWGDHLAGQVETVIFDEVQELRRDGSQKYIASAMIADRARFKLGLTATPVYNYGGEVFNIVNVLAPGRLGDRYEFIREWGMRTRQGHVVISQPGELGSYLRDEGLMLRRTRKDVGRELPEVLRVPHTVESDQETVDRLAADAVALAELIVSKGGTKQERWEASGELDWRLRHATGVAKASYVAGFVKMLLESEEQIVLFGWHRDVYEIWREELAEFNPTFYTGSESPKQKEAARAAFLDGSSRILIMSLRAGAGLDGLQEATHVCVFGELDWSPGMHDQCIGRLHRDGQAEPVVAYFLVSETGADPVIATVLQVKRMQAEPIRDPDAEALETAPDTSDRIRRLAEDFLKRGSAAAPSDDDDQPSLLVAA